MSGKERITCKTFHCHKIKPTQYLIFSDDVIKVFNSSWPGKDFITAIEIQRLLTFFHKLFAGEDYRSP